MGKQADFIKNHQYHLLIGLLLGIWVYLFLVLIGPFDAAPLPLRLRAKMMFGYAGLMILAYYAIIPIQNLLWHTFKAWNTGLELLTVSCVFIIPFLPCYYFYKSDIVRGEFGFSTFVWEQYVPTILILMPLVILIRRGVLRRSKTQTTLPSKITLRGEHSLDVLQLDWTDLICVKSANNYVEVYYQKAGQLHKKLLRTTSKSIQANLPQLKRVHRSYLINPLHFVEWRSKKQIALTHLEVPVSQSYQAELKELTQIRP